MDGTHGTKSLASWTLMIGFIALVCGAPVGDEISTMEKLQNNIKTMEMILEKQQKRLLSGFDGIIKRVHTLEKIADKTRKEIEHKSIVACPSLLIPTHGRVLGARRRTVGDLAYYVCNSGYRLHGHEERVCDNNGTWSGTEPQCLSIFPVGRKEFIMNSDCVDNAPGIRTCSCQTGFRISADQDRCTDVDECSDIVDGDRIMRIEDCQYKCRNHPGSYECLCPPGYLLDNDRRCRDRDECATAHNCSTGLQCLNTFGGYRCVPTGCPSGYVKTGERQCQKIPCRRDNEECSGLPDSIIYHFLAINTHLDSQTKIFRLTSETGIQSSFTRFSVLPGNDSFFFSSRRVDRNTGWLVLSQRPIGPRTLHVDFQASENSMAGEKIATHLAKIVIYVSEYSY